MDWSQEETLQFLELYQAERIIWDPKHIMHKNTQKMNDAWNRISEVMCRPLAELKIKKNSLMATFRQHLRRKKQSIKSGASIDVIYNPIWVYYEIMENFLAQVYKCDHTISTEDEPVSK
ncbi:unnamed protein product [Parnassius mnemosyne]|uniref:MADF domain-containing protein n=1 Tax=Parnassius mnemosyne TaxID=213953 RepID=A0AAV1K7K2_9NEOP